MEVSEREERWRQICREYRRSGMTRKEFSESHGIALSTLGYWLKRLPESKPQDPVREFVSVGTVELERSTMLRIRLGGSVVVELDLPAEQAVIRDVLQAAVSL
jgi:transposase-like protein